MRRFFLPLALLACEASAPATRAAPAEPVAPTPTKLATPTPSSASGRTSNLKLDEEVRVFPAIGHREGDVWKVRVHAWVYEPEEDSWRRAAVVEALRSALELPPGSEASEVFRARARAFLVDNESGKSLLVRIGDREHELASTLPDGHSHTDLRIPAASVRPEASGVVAIDVIPREGDPRRLSGVALLLADTGVSVISDIDDTVKISEVRDKARLLARTFLQELEPVAGMADAYRRWAAAGAAFHYVSASPWQLYDPLDEFFKRTGFPQGSVHLKKMRWKDTSFFALFQDPIAYKRPILAELVRQFPGRRFVLIGDSGELDPEVYGQIYRESPTQIAGLYIRDVTGEDREAPRYKAAFAEVPAERWTIFTDAATLPATLP